MVGNPADAEDLMQEAFLQLYRKIATFRGESAFSTWLRRMTVNVVLMRLRKKSLPTDSLEETLEPDAEIVVPSAMSALQTCASPGPSITLISNARSKASPGIPHRLRAPRCSGL